MLLLPNSSLVLRAFAVLANAAPGKVNYDYHMSYIKDFQSAGYTSALSQLFKTVTDKDLGDLVLANLGLSSVFTSAQAEAYFKANAADRVAAAMNLSDALLNYTGTDAGLKAAQATFSNKIDYSFNWSTTNSAVSNFPSNIDLTTFELTTAKDTLIGSAGKDMFKAYIIDNTNTLQSGDVIQGDAGIDTLFADIGNVQAFAITPQTTGIETVQIRAEATPRDGTNGNNTSSGAFTNLVQIDAQRMVGVNQWESNNSRADVVIEDVRILDSQKTKDITIAFVESDPGNVDFGVYFDQHSLRNVSSSNTSLTIKIMDTGAAGKAETAATPLLNNPYDQFKIGINGVLSTIQLDKTAVKDADTYAALLAVFQTALTGTGISVALGADFTVTDPISNTQVTGKEIVLTGGAGAVISELPNSGWYNTTGASVPATSNIYTTYKQGSSSVTELVTSTIILDDVGRGSTGGDLVVGGQSTGDTSTSRGVERFEIEVRDNSKLQTINSTNNALREVTIKNGPTSKTDDTDGAYSTTVKDEGDLTVLGNAAQTLAGGDQSAGNNQLPGVEDKSLAGDHHGAYGFTDVRVIDASAFKGKLTFDAQISTDSLDKYVNLADTQSNPAGDVAGADNTNFNVHGANFLYTGGNDNDSMDVTIDSAVAASNTLTGQSDFTIVIDGADGNDSITTRFGGNQTAAWAADQKSNNNVTVNGGAGNDTINTWGAGRAKITAGTGDDTVYTDNSGTANGVATWLVNASNTNVDDLQTNGAGIVTGTTHAAKGAAFLYGGKLTVSLSGAEVGGGVSAGAAAGNVADSAANTNADPYGNGFEVVVDIPTGANYTVTQYHVNQAIKAAINGNAVLSKLASATDGPNNTLVIKSKIDGAFNVDDLKMTITAPDVSVLSTTITAGIQASVLTAYKTFANDSQASIADAQTAQASTVTQGNLVNGMDVNQVQATTTTTSAASGISVAITNYVQGVTEALEVQSIDYAVASVAAGETMTLVIDGHNVVYTNGGGAPVAGAALATAIAGELGAGTDIDPGAGVKNYAASAAGTTVTFTQVAGSGKNIATITSTNQTPASGNGAAVVQGTQGATAANETFTAVVTGTAVTGETITIDTIASAALLSTDSTTQLATKITAAANNAAGSWSATSADSVISFTSTVAQNVATDITSASFISSVGGLVTTTTSTGSASTAIDGDNTIYLGAGNDVTVLSTSAASVETLVITGAANDKDTIVNFSTGVGGDKLDFTSYLTTTKPTNALSTSTESQVPYATTLGAGPNVGVNSVVVLNGIKFADSATAAADAAETFANLTGANLLAAINNSNTGAASYGDPAAQISDATLESVQTLTAAAGAAYSPNGIGKAVVLIENFANKGEYKAFEMTWNAYDSAAGVAATAGDFTTATLIGTYDFGASLTGLTAADNLV